MIFRRFKDDKLLMRFTAAATDGFPGLAVKSLVKRFRLEDFAGTRFLWLFFFARWLTARAVRLALCLARDLLVFIAFT